MQTLNIPAVLRRFPLCGSLHTSHFPITNEFTWTQTRLFPISLSKLSERQTVGSYYSGHRSLASAVYEIRRKIPIPPKHGLNCWLIGWILRHLFVTSTDHLYIRRVQPILLGADYTGLSTHCLGGMSHLSLVKHLQTLREQGVHNQRWTTTELVHALVHVNICFGLPEITAY